jgi:hypothetical protein
MRREEETILNLLEKEGILWNKLELTQLAKRYRNPAFSFPLRRYHFYLFLGTTLDQSHRTQEIYGQRGFDFETVSKR